MSWWFPWPNQPGTGCRQRELKAWRQTLPVCQQQLRHRRNAFLDTAEQSQSIHPASQRRQLGKTMRFSQLNGRPEGQGGERPAGPAGPVVLPVAQTFPPLGWESPEGRLIALNWGSQNPQGPSSWKQEAGSPKA